MSRQLILCIDDDSDVLECLEDYFSETRSEFLSTALPEGVTQFLRHHPDLVFINPDLKENRETALREISKGPKKPRILFLGDPHSSVSDGDEIRQSGWIQKPIDLAKLEQALMDGISFPASLRVLVVDDEVEVSGGIKEFLELRRLPRFEVDFALNGLEGFKKIDSFKPDIAILDIKMPVRSGHDLYREIQKRHPDLRTIILTATVAAEEVAEIRKSGSPAFVEKGGERSSFPELLRLIKKQWAFS